MFVQPTSTQPVTPLSKWNDIKGIEAPFPSASSKEFGYWFNYFWSEAVKLSSVTEPQKRKLVDAFFTVFNGPPIAVRPSWASSTDMEKRKVLTDVLLVGFRQYVTTAPSIMSSDLRPRLPAPPALVATMSKDMNLTMVQTVGGVNLPVAFRADQRPWEKVLEKTGFQPRARSVGTSTYSDYALDKPWHPYNDPAFAKSLFLRMGEKNKDNCLHTVISVGAKFAEITHFPILNDGTVFDAQVNNEYICAKPLDLWTQKDRDGAKAHRQNVIAKPDSGEVDFVEKANHMYCFHLNGLRGINTEEVFKGKGGDFPERGMELIPQSHFLAEITFIQRWWFNPEQEALKLFEIEFAPIRWLPTESAVEGLIGKNGMNSLIALIKGEEEKASKKEEYTKEKGRFDAYIATKNTALKPGELKFLTREFALYWKARGPNGKIDGPGERNAMKEKLKAQFPGIEAKIAAAEPVTWSKLRTEAKKVALTI